MPKYNVSITRNFLVTVEADNPVLASQCAEFFLGHTDISAESDRVKNHFQIQAINLLDTTVIDTNLAQ